jgi:hypothetical protein
MWNLIFTTGNVLLLNPKYRERLTVKAQVGFLVIYKLGDTDFVMQQVTRRHAECTWCAYKYLKREKSIAGGRIEITKACFTHHIDTKACSKPFGMGM